MKHLRGIVESPTAPNTTDVLWLDADGGLKAFKNGEWKALVEKGSNSFSIPIIEYGKAENNKILVITEIGTFEGRTGENNNVVDVSVNSSELLNYLKDKYSVYIKTAMDTVEHNASITLYNLVINSSYIRKDRMNGDIYEMEYTFFAGEFMLTFRILK